MAHPTDEQVRRFVRDGGPHGHYIHCQPCCNRIAAEARRVLAEMRGAPTEEHIRAMFASPPDGPVFAPVKLR